MSPHPPGRSCQLLPGRFQVAREASGRRAGGLFATLLTPALRRTRLGTAIQRYHLSIEFRAAFPASIDIRACQGRAIWQQLPQSNTVGVQRCAGGSLAQPFTVFYVLEFPAARETLPATQGPPCRRRACCGPVGVLWERVAQALTGQRSALRCANPGLAGAGPRCN